MRPLKQRLRIFLASDDGLLGRLARALVHRVRRKPIRDRTLLLSFLKEHSVGAEIGVHRGNLSAMFLQELEPSQLHLIDPWAYAASSGHDVALYGGFGGRSQRNMDKRYRGVLRRFAAEIAAGLVRVHRSGSREAANEFEDASLDWVYLDGDHTYEGVRSDLELYLPKVKPGGVIAGDDYGYRGWWDDGVTRAVDEFAANDRVEVEYRNAADGQFVLRVVA